MTSYINAALKSMGLGSGSEPDGNAKHGQPMYVYVGGGTGHKEMVPAQVNDHYSPTEVENDTFVGRVLVRVKDYGPHGGKGGANTSEYFSKPNRRRRFAMLIQGRFKRDVPASDLYFGGAFDHKAVQPTGFFLIWKVATLIDPSLVYTWSDKPYFFSPVASAMNVIRCEPAPDPLPAGNTESDKESERTLKKEDSISRGRSSVESESTVHTKHSTTTASPSSTLHSMSRHKRRGSVGSDSHSPTLDLGPKEYNYKGVRAGPVKTLDDSVLGKWPLSPPHPDDELEEDTGLWFEDCGFEEPPVPTDSSSERRRYFRNPRNLSDPDMVFRKDRIYTFEIFAPFIDLNTYDLSLGLTLNMKRYCENQNLRIVMCAASRDENGGVKWYEGGVCFAVEFRLKEWMGK